MKWIHLLFLASLIFSSANAKWHQLKRLDQYHPIKDFNLKEDILYMEIRNYEAYQKGGFLKPKDKKSYDVLFKAYRVPLQSLSLATQKQFKEMNPIDSHLDTLPLEDPIQGLGCHSMQNIFLIDNKFRIFRMDETKDIYPYIDGIDTDGELLLMLWLHSPVMLDSIYTQYERTKTGFKTTMVSANYDHEKQGCYDSYYGVTHDKNGKILSKKLIKIKKNPDPNSCTYEVMVPPCSQ